MKNLYPLKTIMFLLSIILGIMLISCKKPPVAPPDDTPPTLKQYTWTETKLLRKSGEGVWPTGIWGSSPTDIWVVGYTAAWHGTVFHYDGTQWKDVTPSLPFNAEFMDVFGFSKNEIFIVGDTWSMWPQSKTTALIVKYDGITWQVMLNESDTSNISSLKSIHGNNNKNIWTCGLRGIIYHYDGISWKKVPGVDSLTNNSIFTVPTGETYMLSQYAKYPQTNGWELNYFWELQGNAFIIKDTNIAYKDKYGYAIEQKFGINTLWGVAPDKLFSMYRYAYFYNGNKWSYKGNYNDIRGSSWSNIYGVGDHGHIEWFNGVSWYWIGKYSQNAVDFYKVFAFDNEVYIVAFYDGTIYIVKGVAQK